jgi:hypothetical protein
MHKHSLSQTVRNALVAAALLLVSTAFNSAAAQDVRYSWFEIGYVSQDVDRTGFKADLVQQQVVDLLAQDGPGVRFRGSIGTWNNFYGFFDYMTVDPDLSAVITNINGEFDATDEFDLTTLHMGVGYKFSLGLSTDIIGEVLYDSVTYDFPQLTTTSDFDVDEADIGARLGIRHMFNDDFEARANVRYTNVGDVDLTNSVFDSDVLYGVGFGWQIVRGLSITGDYEAGEVTTWSIGFRLDMDED